MLVLTFQQQLGRRRLFFQHAPSATSLTHFALAAICCIAQKGHAFQASSPKTSKPGQKWPGFFYIALVE
jgi:hypothetical protein